MAFVQVVSHNLILGNRVLVRIFRLWVSLINKSQNIVDAVKGALVLDLKNLWCLAPIAPTLKRPWRKSPLTTIYFLDTASKEFLVLDNLSSFSPIDLVLEKQP